MEFISESETGVANEILENEPQSCLAVLYTFFNKQLHFQPPKPHIFENRSNLASNCRASNR